MADDEKNNEILAATKAAKQRRDAAAATPEPSASSNWPIAAATGVAIGSAALAAALLYANRKKRG